MMYPRDKIIARLTTVAVQREAKSVEAREAADQAHKQHRMEVDDLADRTADLVTKINDFIAEGEYRKASDLSYELYTSLRSLSNSSSNPDYSFADRLHEQSQEMIDIIGLIRSTNTIDISTNELEKLGVLNFVKWGA